MSLQLLSLRSKRGAVRSMLALVLTAGTLAGCAETGSGLLAGGIADQSATSAAVDAKAKPDAAALAGRSADAAGRSAAITPKQPSPPVVALSAAKAGLRAKGLDALAAGDLAKAEQWLRKAVDAKAPDWQTHSALGVVLASAGKQQEAQLELAKALSLAPEHPTVLNNLALSYALDGKAAQAEQLLRRIASTSGAAPHVKNNLALVVAARGQHEEARAIAGGGRANADYLSSLGGKAQRADAEAVPPASQKIERSADATTVPAAYQLGGPTP